MAKMHYQPGRYVCQITGQAMGESSKGNPQFVLRFKVLGRPDPNDPNSYLTDPNQYERPFYRSITEKTIDYFMDDLKALGFHGSSFKDLDPNTPGFHDFKGKEIDMYCNEEIYNGEPRERWAIATAFELNVKPIEAGKLRQLDNLFGKQLKTISKPQSSPRPMPVVTPADVDDDVPF